LLKEYTADVQKLFLEMMLTDAQSFVRVQSIFSVDNFDPSLREAAEFIKEHAEKHTTLPEINQINAATGSNLKLVSELQDGHMDWFMEEFESFNKRQNIERAILKAADLLEQGDYNPVEKLIKDAVQTSLQKDMGTDYFGDPKSRLEEYFNNGFKVSTGWLNLDKILYGGFSKGELNIFAGGSGSGKSLFMMNMAINWVLAGMNGVYISLELSENLTSLRTDAMFTGMPTKEIRKNVEEATMKVNMVKRKAGKYQIKAMPAQSNINDIRSYIKEFQIQTGNRVDFIMVDYLDLLMPVSAKVSPNDLFVKDKYVSEELRNLAEELNILLVTASQLNRSAVEEIEFDHSHISGGISKINTADNVFGIFTSRAMRERGRYQLQCMKNRSGSGVGMKVDLDFDVDTMRITDCEQEEGTQGLGGMGQSAGAIMGAVKTQSTMAPASPAGDTPKPAGNVQSAKLGALLNKINGG
jgi:replicative DNA helicase